MRLNILWTFENVCYLFFFFKSRCTEEPEDAAGLWVPAYISSNPQTAINYIKVIYFNKSFKNLQKNNNAVTPRHHCGGNAYLRLWLHASFVFSPHPCVAPQFFCFWPTEHETTIKPDKQDEEEQRKETRRGGSSSPCWPLSFSPPRPLTRNSSSSSPVCHFRSGQVSAPQA